MPAYPAQRGYIRSFVDLGNETLVNAEITSHQQDAEVTILSNGNILVTYESNLQDGSGLGVFSRILSPDGQYLSADLQMNVTTAGDQTNPQVVALDNGRAMVVWQNSGDIWYRIVEADGTSPAGEFQINETVSANNFRIEKFGSQDFFITWESNDAAPGGSSIGVFGQRFSFNGTKEWSEIRINDATDWGQRTADTAELNSGTVFTVFQSQGQVGAISEQGVYLRNFSNTSTLVGSDILVSDAVGTPETQPQIEALSDGGFVVAYFVGQEVYAKTYLNTGAEIPATLTHITDGIGGQTNMGFKLLALSDNRYGVVWVSPGNFNNDIHYRVLEADGTTVTTGPVHSLTNGTQNFPEVHALPQGGFITAFVTGNSSALDVRIVRHAEDGTPVGPPMQVEYPVNTHTTNAQFDAKVAVTQDGQLVVTWQSVNQDGSGNGVYLQRLDVSTLGTSGNDMMQGTGSGDFLGGWLGKDTIAGGKGSDTLEGGSGKDVIFGGAGFDFVYGGFSDDRLYGANGNDQLYGSFGDDSIYGGAGRDDIAGEEGNDALFGGGGKDVLTGGAGADSLVGGGGNDSLAGGGGRDQLLGSAGKDELDGGGGADTLSGGSGDDSLGGGSGADVLKGGRGRDVLEGGTGNDTLKGQGGVDVFEFTVGSGADVITDFNLLTNEKLRLDVDLWIGTKTAQQVLDDHATVVGSDTTFTFGTGQLVLKGVSDLNALVDDIQFIV